MKSNVTRRALSHAGLPLIVVAAVACNSASEQGSDRLEQPAGPLQQALVTDGQSCMTVQRGTSGQVGDATLWETAPIWNDHENERISTGTSSAGYSRSLLRFDLAAVPTGATVVSASLSLLQNYKSDAGSTVNVLRATAPWSEETVTWSNFGSAFDPVPVASFVVVGGGGTGARTVDVRAVAQDWVSGEAPNHGLVLDDPLDPGRTEFRSSESPYGTERPALTVCYVTCDDGIQNGDETGFDCGGARCAPCNPDPGAPEGPAIEPAGTSLLVQVVSPEGPIAGATISVDGAEVVTDAEGNALLEGLAAGALIAQVRAEGFAPGTVTAELEPGVHGGTTASLLPLSPPVAFDAETGATVVVGAVQVAIPAGALLDENGEPVTGAAEIVFAPLDPTTDDIDSAPGPLVGVAGEGTEPVQLESGFMAEIALTQNGRPLQLAPGATAAVTFTLPPQFAATVAVGDLIPAWWFDHEAAVWRQDGFGVVEPSASDPSALVWTVEVSHFTPWNIDRPFLTSCTNVLVTDQNGTPLPGRPVMVRGLGYSYTASGITGSNGRVCVTMRRFATAQIVVGSTWNPQASTLITPTNNGRCNISGCQAVALAVTVPCGAPGTIQRCAYTGPNGSNGVGACKAGLRVCDGFSWGACTGQVTPSAEVCENAVDEDCDGQLNDGCALCVNGSTEACYTGPANTAGFGQCQAGARTCVHGAWGACTGQVTPKPEVCGNGLDDDCDNLNNEGCVCSVGQTQPCYNGPAGTSGVGQCKDGSRKCYANRASGFWGQCDGEVTPAPETCTASGDEDCDGVANEEGDGCLCAPGTSASCYSGPAGTLDVGACHAGTKTCNAQGTGYGACVGEFTPTAETCTTPVDDDCDGAVNEEGAGCGCVPSPSAPCDSGPAATPILAAGYAHSLAVRSGGSVWAWGNNAQNQLGDGTTTNRSTPVQVQGLTNVTAIAAGNFQSLVVRSDGSVWAWGGNNYGQLGDGTNTNRSTPVQVQGLTNVTAIDAGDNHSLAVRSDGSVWAWGYNNYGQLGDGTLTQRSTPLQVQGLTNVTAIAAGSGYSLVVRSDGSVWAWGRNNYGQLGNGTTTNRSTPKQVQGLTNVTAIAARDNHSLAVRSDGSVRAWGNNFFGQLGDGTTTNRSTPVQVQGLTSVTAIAVGSAYSLAVRSDGSVRAWGYNYFGQLGDGTTTNRSTPVQIQGLTGVTAIAVNYSHSLAMRSDGSIRAWGHNNYGQLGNGTTTNRSTPTQVQGM